MSLGVLGVVSLEPWDQVWRRNQHLAHQLVVQGLVASVVFVEPPSPAAAREHVPEPAVAAVRPRLLAPRRFGGLVATAAGLRRGRLRHLDALWINDATLGVHLLGLGLPTVYDVTDDWRASTQAPRVRRRQVRAEDTLAGTVATVVCSHILRDRWRERYAVEAVVVENGADVTAISAAVARPLPGRGPHAVYIGTLHRDRIDLDLLGRLAGSGHVGSVHLLGPDHLDADARQALLAHGNIVLHAPVPSAEVPGWLVSADVLICPHVISDFTLSLDAIKAHEYLATTVPVVATPTSGFAGLPGIAGLSVVTAEHFAAAVGMAIDAGPRPAYQVRSWAAQARLFAAGFPAAG